MLRPARSGRWSTRPTSIATLFPFASARRPPTRWSRTTICGARTSMRSVSSPPRLFPRNRTPLTRDDQSLFEQPGCLHAGMDLYKWALKLGPLVPGELLLEAFVLARDIRLLDMQAAPYDLADWDVVPVRIETAEGKAEYVRQQRGFARARHPTPHRASALLARCRTARRCRRLTSSPPVRSQGTAPSLRSQRWTADEASSPSSRHRRVDRPAGFPLRRLR